MILTIATGNPGKLKDFRELFSPLNIRILSIQEEHPDFDPEETGMTFEENALLKAREACLLTGLPALADDSGLEVDALGGAPGVLSARYAGIQKSDADNNRKLLEELGDLSPEKRTARFRSVIALCFPDGREYTASGAVEGLILNGPRGTGGFGYDPLFYVPELEATFGEITLEEKNRISHRARAFREIRSLLERLLEEKSAW